MRLIEDWVVTAGETKPTIECPKCGSSLLGDAAPHSIDEDGTVKNSVVCPCGYHENVKLVGWTGGSIPRGKKK